MWPMRGGFHICVFFFRHILPNALAPLLVYALSELPSLFLGVFLLESFFAIPGLGLLMVDAINSSDFPVIRAMTLFVAILTILCNEIADVAIFVCDPRTRSSL